MARQGQKNPTNFRHCLRDPITEIADAAHYLNDAVTAHIAGKNDLAKELIGRADIPAIKDWTESLWGKNSPYVQYRYVASVPDIPQESRTKARMPTALERRSLHLRDGYHCRFCGIPVIRSDVRKRMQKIFPDVLRWGKTNNDCHTAFQAMWAQYDHILPHSKGGNNDLDNIVVTCAPCNFGRMSYTLEEVGLFDPRQREPVRSLWDGLERFK